MGLHWLKLFLLVAVLTCMVLNDSFSKGSETRALLSAWHFTPGLTVFALVWIRLIPKLASPAPLIVTLKG